MQLKNCLDKEEKLLIVVGIMIGCGKSFHGEFEFSGLNTIMGRKWGMEFDEEQQRRLLRFSGPDSKFWKLMREELLKLWRSKNLPRGAAKKGHGPKAW